MEERVTFGSKIGIILATAGSAVGLGNVWRFPYMTGQNGGAAFILAYLGCVLILGLPCIISEFIIGRRGAANTARAYSNMARGRAWKFIGYLGVLTGFLITGYYAVVAGWCLQYMFASVSGALRGDAAFVSRYFTSYTHSTWLPVLTTLLILLCTHGIVLRGVKGGIERASKYMMPLLFLFLIVIVVASCSLSGAWKGVEFLLHPDFSKLTGDVFLGALGQSFYSLSIGMGCICTYASYYSKDTNLLKSAVQVSLVDTLVAVLAGLMIFPAAFSVGVNPDSGPALIFITLPNVFNEAFSAMPGVGPLVAFMFYGLLSMAALTSLISLHEVSTAFVVEELDMSRKKATVGVTLGTWLLGTLCSLSLGGAAGLTLWGKSLFDVFDYVTGQLFLPIGGFLTCLFLGWFVPKTWVYEEFTNRGTVWRSMFPVYLFLLRFVCPVAILTIFLKQQGCF